MITISPGDVREYLGKHILTDGYAPIVDLEKSHGSWLVDGRDGREYLDLFTMFASIPVGYNHPKLLEEKDRLATAALNKPTNSDIYTTQFAECLETFFSTAIPDDFKYCFFVEGGALGIENALKASFDWKVRKNAESSSSGGSKVVHFKDCFHGRAGYTISLTNTSDPRKTDHFPIFDWPRISNPAVRFPLNQENLELTESLESAAIQEIEDTITKHGRDIAALIIEPIQGEGGDHHFRTEFLRSLRQICDESEIMLIFDEVQTGMGLTGKWWAWENHGVAPDMMCFGKKTQVCGFVASPRLDEVEKHVFRESSRINSTWGGNLTDMVRLTIYLNVIAEENLVNRAAESGEYLMDGLIAIQNEYKDLVSNARGAGLMCAFDLPTQSLRDKVLDRIIDNGAIIMGSGVHTVRFRPPLNISTDEIDRGLSIVKKSLDEARG
ncbi:MAG: L-lysine 6-transaminase [Candidatus Marinimicrobia bacterium]|nr:L-lysine 6-transaminase [Candidatus Neomarinimicrobiota bacterium]|tara:strand:- start:396 stop:1712 length:1317 start_codon:yes stop_codon:yes gene_type:complete